MNPPWTGPDEFALGMHADRPVEKAELVAIGYRNPKLQAAANRKISGGDKGKAGSRRPRPAKWKPWMSGPLGWKKPEGA